MALRTGARSLRSYLGAAGLVVAGVGLLLSAYPLLAWYSNRAVREEYQRSSAELARFRAEHAQRRRPAFAPDSPSGRDCMVVQSTLPALPEPPKATPASQPATAAQLDFARVHSEQIAAAGDAALSCDRVEPRE